MIILQALKKWLGGACVWFTAASLVMLLIGILFLPNMDYIATLSYLLFFPFGLCMSCAGMLLRAERIAPTWRILLHFVITLASFILFVFLPSGVTLTLPFIFFFLLLFSIIYWIIIGVLHILRTKKQSGGSKRV